MSSFAAQLGSNSLPSRGQDGAAVSIKSDPRTQSFLSRRGPYYRTPYIGQHGWVSIADPLGHAPSELEQLIVDGYRLAAPRALARRVSGGEE